MTAPSEKSNPALPARSPASWIDWYRFARRTLELSPLEAQTYATARYVEDQNREHLRRLGSR
jgi:hypothetical protein